MDRINNEETMQIWYHPIQVNSSEQPPSPSLSPFNGVNICTLARNGAPLLSSFQRPESIHLFEHVLEEFLTRDYIKVAPDLWVFASKLLKLLRSE